MEGRAHTGVVLAINASGDLKRAGEWDEWYAAERWPSTNDLFDGSTLFRVAPGYLLPGASTHLAIYETSSPVAPAELDELTRRLEEHDGSDRPPTGRTHVTSYTKIHEFGDLSPIRAESVLAILCDAMYPGGEDEFNEWYEHHGPYALGHTTKHVGIRYVADDPRPLQGKFLTLYESLDTDPGPRHREALEWWENHQPADAAANIPLKLFMEVPLERRG